MSDFCRHAIGLRRHDAHGDLKQETQMTNSNQRAARLISLGTATRETKGVATPFAPDENLQHKPMPGLSAD
jgi:hypothetical protein